MQDQKELALETIRRKLVGKTLTYQEIFAVMDEIAHNRLGDILTTYFAASGYSKGFTNEELYFLTKAMVQTGETLQFSGIIADKHSIGGVPGTRTTLIIVPIVAAAGFTIPKSSSRAITTPDGTADDMEVLSHVEFTKKEIYEIIKKANACIVWGGSFHIAPADDVLIHVEKPLLFESYDKFIVSIMAKKIAFGSNHIVIDVPVGPHMKVQSLSDAAIVEEKFLYIAEKFGIHIKVLIHETHQPSGRGIGPILETRESMKVLEQLTDRPMDLETHALHLAGTLLDLCLASQTQAFQKKIYSQFENGYAWANHLLANWAALKKMKEIIEAQGGNHNINSHTLTTKLGNYSTGITATHNGIIKEINSKNSTLVAKILGAPTQKGAGIYLDKKIGEHVKKDDVVYTLYSESMYNLREAKLSLKNFPPVSI